MQTLWKFLPFNDCKNEGLMEDESGRVFRFLVAEGDRATLFKESKPNCVNAKMNEIEAQGWQKVGMSSVDHHKHFILFKQRA
jgi:hypothetical protein